MFAGVEVLAAGGDDDVLLAAGDLEEAVVVELADVAGVQPAVDQRVGGRLGVLPVLPEDIGPPHQDLVVVLGDPDLDARQRLADRAELEVVERADGADAGGLGHAPALHHRHPGRVEELEDLRRDRRGAADRLAHVAAEQLADLGEDLLVGLVELRLHLLGDRLAALLAPADLDAELDRLPEALLVLVGGVLLHLRRGRVQLLEDPRDRGQVGRLGLDHLGEDLLRVAAEVDDRRALVIGGELREQREDVRERQVQVGRLVGLDELELLDDVADLHRVGVCEHDALGRTGRARRVDDDPGVVAARRCPGGAASADAVAAGASLAELVERHLAGALLDPDHVLEVGQLVADLIDLLPLPLVLDDDRPRARVARDPLALLRGVGRVDRDDHGPGGGDRVAGERPLEPRVGEDADPVARLDPEVDQSERELLDRLPGVGVGQLPPTRSPSR